MNTQIKKTLEVWHCTDARFPAKTTRPVGNKALDTLRGEVQEDGTIIDGLQLQPVGVIKKGKNITFVWGQGRLQRIRDFYTEGMHTGNVDVLVLEGVDPHDFATLSMIENAARSPNRLNDYRMMQEMREGNPMISYTEIYNATGLNVGTLKKLDKQFGKLPIWARNAMLRGEIKESVALAISSLGDDTKLELKEKFKQEGTLTATDVKETRQAVQASVYATMSTALFPDMQGRDWFSREELLRVRDCMESEQDRAVIDDLLSQP